jgi:acetyl-CoA synthetase
MREKRIFAPPKGFAKTARVGSTAAYQKIRRAALKNPLKFWESQARHLRWMKPWKKTLDGKAPFFKWFTGGRLNVADNCLDRHVETWRRNKAAIIWEGEPGEERVLTYQDLHREVGRFANGLKKIGVVPGDRVTLYMPLVPELAVAMLACARIGAVHSVIFGGFSAQAIRDRIADQGAKWVVTADGGYRRGAVIALKGSVDEALLETPTVEKVVVLRRTGAETPMRAGRDLWWHELVEGLPAVCPAEPLDAEHPLYILYTSGSTGKPKGVLHTTGGYLTQAAHTTQWVFDLKDEDVYWCTADIGWVTGHSYVVYGPLANGATVVMYEGAPNWPEPDRFWRLIEKYRVTILYTAPTAIRAFIKWGEAWPKKHDLSSLRLLGSVGEPINPEVWMWYHRVIGGGRCPIVDTWWQTETGAILIAPLPGAVATKPGSATFPLPGIDATVVDKTGKEVGGDAGGFLVVRKPWPALMRTIYGDDERYKKHYWSEIPGVYFAGDGARRDKDGYFWVMGRIDDVIKVSGHRLGTAEIESALVSHDTVAEAAVVGRPDDLTGEAVVAFVTLEQGRTPSPALKEELRAHVAQEIGSLAKPAEVRFADTLPKTRSGKIMRRLLRDVASGRDAQGDTTTLEDFSVLSKLRADSGEE